MRALSRILKLLATGTVSVVLAACYGVVYTMDGLLQQVSGTVNTVRKSDGLPIPGLKVELFTATGEIVMSGRTNVSGYLDFAVAGPVDLPLYGTVSDIDGAENGGYFETAELLIRDSGLVLSVELETAAP